VELGGQSKRSRVSNGRHLVVEGTPHNFSSDMVHDLLTRGEKNVLLSVVSCYMLLDIADGLTESLVTGLTTDILIVVFPSRPTVVVDQYEC
jgi:hypothetical protein